MQSVHWRQRGLVWSLTKSLTITIIHQLFLMRRNTARRLFLYLHTWLNFFMRFRTFRKSLMNSENTCLKKKKKNIRYLLNTRTQVVFSHLNTPNKDEHNTANIPMATETADILMLTLHSTFCQLTYGEGWDIPENNEHHVNKNSSRLQLQSMERNAAAASTLTWDRKPKIEESSWIIF